MENITEGISILHITPTTDGYEEVLLIANNVSKTNSLALIEKDGKRYMTGGLLLEKTEEIKNLLDSFPKEKHYNLVRSIKLTPFAKMYENSL